MSLKGSILGDEECPHTGKGHLNHENGEEANSSSSFNSARDCSFLVVDNRMKTCLIEKV